MLSIDQTICPNQYKLLTTQKNMSPFISLTLLFAFKLSNTCFGFMLPKVGYITGPLDGTFQNEVGTGPVLRLNSYETDLIWRKPVILALVAKQRHEAMPNWKEKAVTHTSRFLKILLEDVWQEYQIIERYNFVVPKINISCEFDCEYIDRCNNNIFAKLTSSGNCGTEHTQCYKKYFSGYSCKTCSGGSCTVNYNGGAVCCVLSISPDEENMYYAFHFEVPKTYYKLSWTILDKNNRTIVHKEVRLESPKIETSIAEIESGIKVESFPAVANLHSKWGFVHRKDLRLIKTRTTMNNAQDGIFSPNLNELGWYQLDYYNTTIRLKPHFVEPKFDITVHNFDAKEYTWHFNATGCENGDCGNINGDILLKKYGFEIANAELFLDRNVIVRLRQNPQLKVTLNLGLQYEDVLSENDFNFETFTATLTVTENENVASVLNIAVVDGYGRMRVTISSTGTDNFFETETILIPSLVRRIFQTKIILSKKLNTTAWVCLTIPTRPERPERRECCNISHQTTTQYQETTTTPMKPATTRVSLDIRLGSFTRDTKHTHTMSVTVIAIIAICCSVLVIIIIIVVILRVKKHQPVKKRFRSKEGERFLESNPVR